MKKIIYPLIVLVIVLLAACTVHFPYEWGVDYREYRIILLVEPDDAEVLLDGKLIGEAYEFSKPGSALRLQSTAHELVVKKKGYIEEAVNLRDYSTEDITVRLKLLPERHSYPSSAKKGKVEAEEPEKPEYTPKTEPAMEPPKEPPKAEMDETEKVEAVNVTIEITPTESSIYLNGRFWGITPENGRIDNLRLKPGKYTLEVVKPGFKAYKTVLDVKDKDIKLIIKLAAG